MRFLAREKLAGALVFSLAMAAVAPCLATGNPHHTGAGQRAFLAAAARAASLRVLALQPEHYRFVAVGPKHPKPGEITPPPAPVDVPVDCSRVRCIVGVEIVKESVVDGTRASNVRKVLRRWLQDQPAHVSACMPLYHHAIAFSQGGHEYVALLCYSCHQYALLVDGKPGEDGEAPWAGEATPLDAILAK